MMKETVVDVVTSISNNNPTTLFSVIAFTTFIAGAVFFSYFHVKKKTYLKSNQPKRPRSNELQQKVDNITLKNTDNIMRGYKETKEGKKTSYFHRELSIEEKELLGDCSPQRIDANTIDNGPKLVTKRIQGTGEISFDTNSSSGSVWNSAGTFEERDISSWTKSRLKHLLKEIQISVNGEDLHDTTLRSIKVGSFAVCKIYI